MQHKTFSAYHFTDKEIPFDIKQYSTFKHGSRDAANRIAEELFMNYQHSIPTTDKEFILFPSPYHFIPSACSLIKDRFLILLNRWLVDHDRLPAVESNIHRRLSYHSDYGKMGDQEREVLIAGDKFYIDQEYIKDKFCLFLDDVRITGSHERVVLKLVPPEVDHQVIYYAQYTGKDSTIENRLNTNYVSNLFTLMPLIMEPDFVFNVRNIRLILTQKDGYFEAYLEAICKFKRSKEWAQELYDWCIGNHFHNVPIYKQNILKLKQYVATN